MEYTKVTQNEYLNILAQRKKSLFIGEFDTLHELENVLFSILESDLNKCYKDNNFLTLLSGNKSRMVFKQDNETEKVYSNLEGKYTTFAYMGFDFVINEKEKFYISFLGELV